MTVLTKEDKEALRRLREVARARAVAMPLAWERRAIRVRAGLSGREFARLLGVAPSTLSCWETAQRTPRGSMRDRYAEALAILKGDEELNREEW